MAGATIKPQSTAGVSAPTSGSDETRLWSQAGMCIVEAVLGFLILYGCLIVVDLPLLDTYPDRKLNTLRYVGIDNVYRDEDYSRYHVNSFGLIGPEPAPVSDKSVYRIAVFGDSFVEALQVPQERKFAALLEDALAAPNGKRRVEVWNVGHSADNTGNAYARWLQLKNTVQFDFVVFAFNEGDVLENRL